MVASFSKTQKEIDILTAPSGAPPARYVPDISRAKSELGLNVNIDLEAAIRRTIAFYSQPD